jgi:uncharacterized repeat protein (TIGR03833 family)
MKEVDEAGKHLVNIKTGLAVEIFPKEDHSGKNPIQGVVSEILTHSSFHSHGIMVRLEDGKIGRIHKILSDFTPSTPVIKTIQSKEIDFLDLVKKGENEFVEFKSSTLWSKNLTEEQMKAPTASREVRAFGREASKAIIAKAISGFLNTQGGHLIIGIKENKTQEADDIIGIETEFGKIEDQCTDGYRRMIVDSIIRKYLHPDIYNHFSDYIKITFPEIDRKILCWIQISKSDVPAFVTIQKNDYFFIRLDAEIRELDGKQMVEYYEKRFKN